MGALERLLVFHLAGLLLDSLVNQSSKVGEVMNSECKLDVWVQSITELLLLASIGGDIIFSIAG